VKAAGNPRAGVKLVVDGKPTELTELNTHVTLKPGTWVRDKDGVIVCFDLAKGENRIAW
jgi:hypothetical protein